MRLKSLEQTASRQAAPAERALDAKRSEHDLLEEFSKVLKQVARKVNSDTKPSLEELYVAPSELAVKKQVETQAASHAKPEVKKHDHSALPDLNNPTEGSEREPKQTEAISKEKSEAELDHSENALRARPEEEDTQGDSQEQIAIEASEQNPEVVVQTIPAEFVPQKAEPIELEQEVDLEEEQADPAAFEQEVEFADSEGAPKQELEAAPKALKVAKAELLDKKQVEKELSAAPSEIKVELDNLNKEVKSEKTPHDGANMAQGELLREFIFQKLVQSSAPKLDQAIVQPVDNKLTPEVLGLALKRGILEINSAAAGDPRGNQGQLSNQAANQGRNIASTRFDSSIQRAQSSLSSQDSESAKQLKPLPRPLASRALEQVEKAVREAASGDSRSISLRLDPPSLGSVKVDLSLKDGVLHARLAADSPQVNQLLRDKAHDLQQSLRKLGLNVDNIQVNISGHGSEQSFEHSNFRSSQHTGDEGANWIGLGRGSGLEAAEIASHQSGSAQVYDHWVA